MKLRITQEIEKKEFHPKICYFGLDEVDFSQNFGWSTEFVGYLKPLPMEEDDVYIFYLEKITRDNRVGSLHVLDVYDEEEYSLILKALITDYNIKKANIEFL